MTLTLYNTLTREKQTFTPIDEKNVRMYVCGPTVYNYAHIGNARPAVVFDLLDRLLRHIYGDEHVTYARNITDIDDKIITAAKETGADISTITEKFTRIYHEDMGALGVRLPDVEPHATEYIDAMIDMITTLIEKGYAYEGDGHVLFNVPAFEDYGQLSRRNRDDMVAGARVEVAPYKKDPADFVLWKPSSDDQPGWDSPWGRGRPGWHIECSAMSGKIFGDHFDIHGGGLDLIFPHHENEIAQSTCAHSKNGRGEKMANYWLHNGFLSVENEKMSKSLGNVKLVHDLLKEVPGEAIRLALLSAHYRQPLDWTEDALKQARRTLDRMYNILRGMGDVEADASAQAPRAFIDALKDDLNTPRALAELSQLSKEAAAAKADEKRALLKGRLLKAGAMLGILQQAPEAWFKQGGKDVDESRIESLIAERIEARKSKDFARADAIRDELEGMGVVIEDTPEGTQWRLAG